MSKRGAILAAGIAFGGWLLTRQAEAATHATFSVDQARDLVTRLNRDHFGGWFEVADVMAIIEIESAFNPDAYRWEPHLTDASIGLMQILHSSAQDRGFTQGPAALFAPEVNLYYGMAHLRWGHDFLAARMAEPPAYPHWIGAYNAGVGNVLQGKIPLVYVERWLAARERYR